MKITANPKRQSTKTAAITATTIRAVLSASPLVPICCSGGFAPECSLLSDEVFLVSPRLVFRFVPLGWAILQQMSFDSRKVP